MSTSHKQSAPTFWREREREYHNMDFKVCISQVNYEWTARHKQWSYTSMHVDAYSIANRIKRESDSPLKRCDKIKSQVRVGLTCPDLK